EGTAPPNTIAVVGGGIGGTAATYFLRQLYGSDLQIDLYEPSNVLCGRVATIEIAGRRYESGGSILHPSNRYSKSIAGEFGLRYAERANSLLSFHDGEKFLFRSSEWKIVTIFRLLWTFGFDLIRLHWFTKSYMDMFDLIYNDQKMGHSYTNVHDLLFAVGQDTFINATKVTACKLFAEQEFGKNLIDLVLNGGLLTNYGQTCEVNGFVGAVAMAGIQPGLWSIRGGNNLLCSKLHESSSAHWKQKSVTKVSLSSDGKFSVSTSENEAIYDHVVIASPINRDKNNIDVSTACSKYCPSTKTDLRHYRRTVATFVKGKLNSKKFQCDSLTSCPVIMCTSNSTFFRCRAIGLHLPVDYDNTNGDTIDSAVYKVFSDAPLTKNQLHQLFEASSEIKEADWFAYPLFSPPEQLDSFVLHEGLYYTSPIERAASAIEMSLVSAKNAALLSYNHWYALPRSSSSKTLNDRTEL
uniref:Prenylcysteine lyase domain-containing protein n=1 Tax=Ciona intestinalis TaxID=7719 RepID=F6QM57_CIOIN